MGPPGLLVEELELPFPPAEALVAAAGPLQCSRFGVFDSCPLCGGELAAEHAHFRCGACGWRDSCCD